VTEYRRSDLTAHHSRHDVGFVRPTHSRDSRVTRVDRLRGATMNDCLLRGGELQRGFALPWRFEALLRPPIFVVCAASVMQRS